jgi:cation:H+ antiporter
MADLGSLPNVLIGVALLAVAAAVLVGGAELFVENLSAAASRLGMSVLAVAVLLAGAEPEEALTSALASAADRPALAVGDAIGANLTVLGLALGLAALVSPLPVGRRVRRYAVMASVAGVCALAVLADGQASRAEGLLLVAAYAVVVGVVWWREKAPPRSVSWPRCTTVPPGCTTVLPRCTTGQNRRPG